MNWLPAKLATNKDRTPKPRAQPRPQANGKPQDAHSTKAKPKSLNRQLPELLRNQGIVIG